MSDVGKERWRMQAGQGGGKGARGRDRTNMVLSGGVLHYCARIHLYD